MFRKLLSAAFVFVLAAGAFGQKASEEDEKAVRAVVEQWDAGYHALDPKAMSATVADEFDLVDRFGQTFSSRSRAEYEAMWTWAFANVYNGKPGPKHVVDRVRFLTADSALVRAAASRTEPVILPDGKKIPPFTQLATFVLVRRSGKWQIAAHNVNNRFADPHDSQKKSWEAEAKAN